MSFTKQVQELSDALHDGLDDIDNLLYRSSERLQLALKLRIESGMTGRDAERTIKKFAEQISDIGALRQKHVLAHASAQLDAERAAWPFKCPDEALNDPEVTPLSIVK
jgi:hypothetical protein